MKLLKDYLPNLPPEFLNQLEQYGVIKNFDAATEILREGQFVKFVPLVLEGVVKVFTRAEEKELLLYYIERGESCIMSFNAGMQNTPSKVFAVAAANTGVVLLPVEKLHEWLTAFPSLNALFYQLYDQRYASLLETINQLLYNRLDQRLLTYLQETARQKNSNIVNIRHRQIAADLGTAREVVSRVMKKLELEGKVKQLSNAIQIM